MDKKDRSSRLLTKPVVALVLLNTFAVFSWIAYDRLQPVALQVLEVSDQADLLDMLRSVVMLLVPVLAGWLGGGLQQRAGSLLPLVMTGMVSAGVIFFLVALNLQWILVPAAVVPLLIFCWLVAMQLFVGPANSLLATFTGRQSLPLAVGISLMVADLLYAMERLIGDVLYDAGLVTAFTGAGIGLLAVAWFFRSTFSDADGSSDEMDRAVSVNRYGRVILAGLVCGLMVVTVEEYLPIWVMGKAVGMLPANGTDLIVPAVLLMAAAVSVPSGRFVERAGVNRSMVFGIMGMVFSLAFTFVVPDAVATLASALACGGFLGLLTVAVFPFTAGCLRSDSVSFGTGLLFSAAALPEVILGLTH